MRFASSHRSAQTAVRIVLAVAVFLVILGGLAWMLQFMPNNGGQQTPDSEEPLVTFTGKVAVWTPDDERYTSVFGDDKKFGPYLKEFEIKQEGHYDFEFKNISGQDLEIVLDHAACTCTQVLLAILPEGSSERNSDRLMWTSLKTTTKTEIDPQPVPAKCAGLVRMTWERKEADGNVELSAKMDFRRPGTSRGKQTHELKAHVRIVPPLIFTPHQVKLDTFQDEVKRSVYCWSATRDDFLVYIDKERVEPGFSFKRRLASPKEIDALYQLLKEEKKVARVRKAYVIDVTVFEKSHGIYLGGVDGGSIDKHIPFRFMGNTWDGPRVIGRLDSGVNVTGARDGHLDLGKIPNAGMTKTFELTADPNLLLTLLDHPINVKTSLAARKAGNSGRRSWELTLGVEAYTELVDPNTVVLRTQPIPEYLADIANAVTWGSGQAGPFTTAGNFANLIAGYGGNARRIRLAVVKD